MSKSTGFPKFRELRKAEKQAQKRYGQEGKGKVSTREHPLQACRGTQPETLKDRGKTSMAIIVGCVERRVEAQGQWAVEGWLEEFDLTLRQSLWSQKMMRKESVVCQRSI